MKAENEKQFPAGLRVLVVDNDVTCLRRMYELLTKCQYIVATTNKGWEALQMLREDNNRFDIVISDVEIPGMDGIQLLRIIALEMDIPVIMLSTYSDQKRAMQGVTNGAVDYLVKPVRIQELQNIWQHVLRKRNVTPLRPPSVANIDNSSHSEKLKGKDKAEHSSNGNDFQNDGEQEGSEAENEGSTNPKKPRLFWTVDLHQKFVDAVNQLGIEKAFPKKILDIMNIEGLTREKVASHLQKYRLYLRKLRSVQNQGANKMMGVEDRHIGSLGEGYGIYQSLSGPTVTARYPPPVPNPYARGMLGRLNTTSGMNLHTLSSIPVPQQQNSNTNPFTTLGNYGISAPFTQNFSTFFQNYSTSMQHNGGPFFFQPQNTLLINQAPSQNTLLINQATPQNTFLINQAPPPSTTQFGNQLQPSYTTATPHVGGSVGGEVGNASYMMGTVPSPFQPPSSHPNLYPSNIPAQKNPNDPFYFLNDLTSFEHLRGNQDGLNVNGGNFLGQGQALPGNTMHDYFMIPYSVGGSGSAPAIPDVAAPTPDQSFSQHSNLTDFPFSMSEAGSSQFLQQEVQQECTIEPSGLRLEDFLVDDEPKERAGEYLEDIVGKYMKQGEDGGTAGNDALDIDSLM